MLQGSQQCYFSLGFTLEQYCIFDYKSNNHIEKNIYRKSSIKPPTHLSKKPPPSKKPTPFFRGKKLISPPLYPSPNYISLIDERLY